MRKLEKIVNLPIRGAISAYQAVSCNLPRRCRFEPSCSEYCKQAIVGHGPIKGLVLAVWRVLRCNPFGAGGFDPVKPRSAGFTNAVLTKVGLRPVGTKRVGVSEADRALGRFFEQGSAW